MRGHAASYLELMTGMAESVDARERERRLTNDYSNMARRSATGRWFRRLSGGPCVFNLGADGGEERTEALIEKVSVAPLPDGAAGILFVTLDYAGS